MSKNADWNEINRKIFHIIGGIILAILIYYDILKIWSIIAILVIGIIISILYRKYDLPIINYFLNKFEREHLRKKFPGKGVIYLFLALLFMRLLFEKEIVIAGVMIWTFGDSMSAIVGKHYGKIKHPLNNERLIEGTIAGIICGSIAASFFVYWPFAFIGATISMMMESLEWKLYTKVFDDNLFVPLIGSFVIFLCTILF
ncbi:MAG: diacylglycerol/polyprenol kinase family protein [Candidatus Woesearchaeota archaeon]